VAPPPAAGRGSPRGGGHILFFSAFAPWMASHFGNRFLFVPVLASALPLAALFDGKWLRRIGLGAKTVHPEGAGA